MERVFLHAPDRLNLFAFLPSDEIPKYLLVEMAGKLPERLAAVVGNDFGIDECIAALRSFPLIK